jgi:agmatinase
MTAIEPFDPALFKPALGFMGLPIGHSLEGAKAAILGMPFDCGTSPVRIGARHGPSAIRQQSQHLRRHYPPFSVADPFEALAVVDCGDAAVTPGRIEPSFEVMEQAMSLLIAEGAVSLTFGGDGAVTLPQLRAHAKRHPDLCVLHFDAHTDCYRPQGQDYHNTGTTFTRAAEEGLLDCANSFHIGARGTTYQADILDYSRGQGYRIIPDQELQARGIPDVLAEVREALAGRPVYLCWDMDVFDPSAAPGVCDPTWGGITPREGIQILQGLKGLGFVAYDINTVTPPLDSQNMTAHLAATVALLCLHLSC